jgi:Cu(I)/Ag(I) efflux system membrane fusion protein
MTTRLSLRRVAAPIGSALATAAVFSATLWVQYERRSWPFAPAETEGNVRVTSTDVTGPSVAGPSQGRVAIDATDPIVERLDMRLEIVGHHSISDTVRAVATVVPDESSIAHVHTRVSGWVERLDVNTTGEFVRVGQPILRIFSQELLSSQTEYLVARKQADASGITSAVIASGRTRLEVLGMLPEEIDAIEHTGEPRRLVTVVAPRTGIVVDRGVTVGTSVDPSTTLVTIADLSRVWILAEVPETNIRAIRSGMATQLDFPASGRAPFSARVDFIYPTLTERTRTLRVRLSAANANGMLRPGLFGTATFASTEEHGITVPRDAVVDTGQQQHVYVAIEGRFEPRLVTLGVQLADRVEIRSGLKAGEEIVVAGVFLLDSESRLRATGNAGGHNHGASAPAAKPLTPSTDPHAAHKSPAPPVDPHAGHRE